MKHIILKAQAKLNLTLRVLGARPDGFHNIESVVQSVDLHDQIYLRTGSPNYSRGGLKETDIRLTCNNLDIPRDRSNLATGAALALSKLLQVRAPIEINITKGIPVGAGLGGGSADAAALLVGLNRLWGANLCPDGLMSVGESLGADIPFCIKGGTGVIRGKGEQVESLPTPDNLWFVISTPPVKISTACVYNKFNESTMGTGVYDPFAETNDITSRISRAITEGNIQSIPSRLINHLEPAALTIAPEIAEAKQVLFAAGATRIGMSGSGPTVFGITDSRAEAEKISDAVSRLRKEKALICQAVSQGVIFVPDYDAL
ncbi:MAG: 4-(cytidine 5'-diphospho)-2-C-methyl-D-erythritol kinase [Firmicutes bacterium]|nr:4-(cytidine 5'-diphospho)-2-C-methyl-D-erythritol kinase [Bacillota bacterium]